MNWFTEPMRGWRQARGARAPCTCRAPAPLAPDTERRPGNSTGQDADRERRQCLLQVIVEAVANNVGVVGEWPEFEWIVLQGVAGLPGRESPPPGHGCPRSMLVGAVCER
ncbi:hypothetical protein OHA91_38575 [Streptomyces erythrochromogenes]|uniref:Uncharacterized protein n=1 Tax=Streptomyces erythrochromogenes TaxID=285574 RepID=A0ABZ1QN56_9ACTN|nr:hypothetical protein [Streptomyces erythrochromogenes]